MSHCTKAHRRRSTFDVLDRRDACSSIVLGAGILPYLDTVPARVRPAAMMADGKTGLAQEMAVPSGHHHCHGPHVAALAKKKTPKGNGGQTDSQGAPGPAGPPGPVGP